MSSDSIGRVRSVNVSLPKTVSHRGRPLATSIFKESVQGPVLVRRLSLAGDWPADLRYHGGLNKAVYAYPSEHYPFWAAELSRDDLRPGQFGENLTTEGLLEDVVRLGDVYRFGASVLQVTQPRTPCFKLGIRMGSPTFPKRFLTSGRLGFYFRVVEEGEVAAGDSIDLIQRDPGDLTIRGLWQLVYGDGSPDAARVALRHDTLGPEWREPLEQLAAG